MWSFSNQLSIQENIQLYSLYLKAKKEPPENAHKGFLRPESGNESKIDPMKLISLVSQSPLIIWTGTETKQGRFSKLKLCKILDPQIKPSTESTGSSDSPNSCLNLSHGFWLQSGNFQYCPSLIRPVKKFFWVYKLRQKTFRLESRYSTLFYAEPFSCRFVSLHHVHLRRLESAQCILPLKS